jgi:hypothetical protein
MELHFTHEQEAQLAQIASQEGTDAERLVKEAALRLLQEDARFRAAVREGIAQADRGKRKWTPAWSRCCAHKNVYPLRFFPIAARSVFPVS